MTDLLATARIVGTVSGAIALVPGTRTDAIPAAAWALSSLVSHRGNPGYGWLHLMTNGEVW